MGRRTSTTQTGLAVEGGSATSTTDYDLRNRVVVTTAAGGARTTTTLDAMGRTVRTFTSTGMMEGASPIEQQFAYDIDGNQVFATDMHTASASAFDAHGRLVATKASDGTVATTEYDEWGNPKTEKELDDSAQLIGSTTYDYTDAGRLKTVTTATGASAARVTELAWDGGGRTTSTATNGRASKSSYDSAGRFLHNAQGKGDLDALEEVFTNTNVTGHDGAVPAQMDVTEKSGPPITTQLVHNAAGNVATQRVGTLEWSQRFDQLGNVTAAAEPNRPASTYEVDARGAVKTETLPDGAEQKHEYTANGVEKKFIDPTEEDTQTINDLVGRPLRRIYKDGTTEVVEWEGTRIKSVTDRQSRKQTFGYNSKGQVTTVSDDNGIIDRLAYDSAGRLQSWTNKESEITWREFDLEGRPKKTTQKRFRNDSGLADNPVVLDEYTQEHRWNEHGERTHWSMPRYAGLTLGAGWSNWISEQHDAMGNVTLIGKTDGPTSTEAAALMVATYRNAGRPEQRTVYAGGSVPILRTYGYNPATSLLQKVEVSVKDLVIAGSDVQHDGLQVMDARLLGLSSGERYTKYDYDDRSRVRASLFGTTLANADPTAAVPGQAREDLTAADFRTAQARVQQLPGSTAAGDPPSKTITERGGGGHKIEQVTRGPLILPYGYNGSEVVDDGRFTYVFNAKGRLISATEKTIGTPKRRALYSYSGNGRLVGRRAEYTSAATPQAADWKLEDRIAIIRADGLPAETTFVWDAITDRLITVAKAGASSTDPHGGLLKQITHGGSAYDDPLETATIDPDAPTTVNYLYPLYDEAGAGSLQAVLNKRGELVGRNLSNDPFGGEELDLTGGAIDRARVTAKKNAQGELTSVTVDIRSTEAIAASTIATGVRLATVDADARVRTTTAAAELADANTVRWTMSASEWATFTRDAATLSGRGDERPARRRLVSGPSHPGRPDWAVTTGRATTSAQFLVEIRESLASLSSFLAGIPDSGERTTKLYEVESLALLGTRAAANQIDDTLTARMHAHPFTDPLTQLDYVRERWYQPLSGSWLTPDPMGYQDSANMYAFAAGDPVNARDPLGRQALPQPTPKVPLPSGPGGKVIPFPQPTVTPTKPPLNVGGPIVVGLVIQWTINKGAQFLEEDADNYVEWSRQRDSEIKITAAKRRNGGCVLPRQRTEIDAHPKAGPGPAADGDPCDSEVEQIAGSRDTHINGAIAEDKGWRWALAQGHIGIMPPSKVTTPGPDYITYNPFNDTVYVWDAKYRREGGRYPCKGPSLEKVAAWMDQIRDANGRLSDEALRQKVLRALSRGRIRGAVV